MKSVFNPNIPIYPPNSAKGLHFSAFHIYPVAMINLHVAVYNFYRARMQASSSRADRRKTVNLTAPIQLILALTSHAYSITHFVYMLFTPVLLTLCPLCYILALEGRYVHVCTYRITPAGGQVLVHTYMYVCA